MFLSCKKRRIFSSSLLAGRPNKSDNPPTSSTTFVDNSILAYRTICPLTLRLSQRKQKHVKFNSFFFFSEAPPASLLGSPCPPRRRIQCFTPLDLHLFRQLPFEYLCVHFHKYLPCHRLPALREHVLRHGRRGPRGCHWDWRARPGDDWWWFRTGRGRVRIMTRPGSLSGFFIRPRGRDGRHVGSDTVGSSGSFAVATVCSVLCVV